MKSKLLLLISLFALGLTSVRADSPLSVTAEVDYTSAFVFRGDKLSGNAAETTVNVQFGAGYLNLWNNLPVHSAGSSNEVDYMVGYSRAGFDAGLNTYTYRTLNDATGDKWVNWEPYVGYSNDFAGVNGSLYAYYNATSKVYTYEGKLSKGLDFTKRISLTTSATLGTVHGKEVTTYQYWTVSSALALKVSNKITATVSEAYNSASSTDHSRNQWVSLVGLKYAF